MTAELDKKVRPRLLRALGRQDPPRSVEVNGQTFEQVEVLKHDSWAASALYENVDRRIVCKFNRVQPAFGLPLAWLGRLLARREFSFLNMLHDVPGIPQGFREVKSDGRIHANAVAHEYVTGHPLRWHDDVDEEFFPRLREILQQMHARRIVYVDLHKRENIIVGRDGRPYLIDFQISVKLPRIWPISMLLRVLQRSDHYHLSKHVSRQQPESANGNRRPWWIKIHRIVAVPLRGFRRRLLVLLGVRKGNGKALSEATVEDAFRSDQQSDSPLPALLASLTCDAYFLARGGTFPGLANGMFEDVFNCQPALPHQKRFLRKLAASRSRTYVAVEILRAFRQHLQKNQLPVKEVVSQIEHRIQVAARAEAA